MKSGIYMDVNHGRNGRVLEPCWPAGRQFKKLIVASSMSIYGEGRYKRSNGELVAPTLRTTTNTKRAIGSS